MTFSLKNLQPDLIGVLFVERSGTKKREWKAEIAAQKKLNLNY